MSIIIDVFKNVLKSLVSGLFSEYNDQNVYFLSISVKILHKLVLNNVNIITGESKGTSSIETIITRAYNQRHYGNIKDNLEFSCFLTAAVAKGHPFNDGNKRTAALLLQIL